MIQRQKCAILTRLNLGDDVHRASRVGVFIIECGRNYSLLHCNQTHCKFNSTASLVEVPKKTLGSGHWYVAQGVLNGLCFGRVVFDGAVTEGINMTDLVRL